MQNNSLLFGIGGFILGGLVVAVAATTFNKPSVHGSNQSMSQMTQALTGKSGDNFDAEFISEMTGHHEGAIDMANLALTNAKHPEVKKLARNIIAAQTSEIAQMKNWQKDWGYTETSSSGMRMMNHDQ